MRRGVFVKWTAPVLGLMLVCGCEQREENGELAKTPIRAKTLIRTSRGQLQVPGSGFIDGRDLEASPPLTIGTINVWDAASRKRVVCRLEHGTAVGILEAKFSETENRYYLRIRTGDWDCEGWVPESFVSPELHAPVGKKM